MLSGNALEAIPSETFRGLESLIELDLSKKRFSSLKLFKNLSRSGSNFITIFEADPFPEIFPLLVINLSFNDCINEIFKGETEANNAVVKLCQPKGKKNATE